VAGEIPLGKSLRYRADDDGIRRRQPLEASRNIRGVAQGELFLPSASTHLPHHDYSGVDPHADRQADPRPLSQAAVEGVQRLDNAQPGMHSALRIVFMRLGIAKIDQQAVAEILGDMPVKALDDLGTGGLVGAHHLPQIFGIELARERGRIHQVTEQHSELAAFRVRWVRGGCWQLRVCVLLRRWLGQWRGWLRWCASVPSPNQAAVSVLDHRMLGIEEFGLEVCEQRVVQGKLTLQRPIGHASSTA